MSGGFAMATMLAAIRGIQQGEVPPPAVASLIGFTIAEVEPGLAVVEFEAGERHANPMGTLHGGILCDIADAAMGMAYASSLEEPDRVPALDQASGRDQPTRPDRLEEVDLELQGRERLVVVECDIHDDKDRLVARASSTCMTLRGTQATGR